MANSFRSGGERLYQPRFLARWLRKDPPHPDTFDCGIRIVRGRVDGESGRWKYRRSAVDPLIVDGVVTLNHGKQTLVLVIDAQCVPVPDKVRGRLGFVVFTATERVSQAGVEVSVVEFELSRFGL